MEHRNTSITKPSTLPVDYLEMVSEIFTAHFDSEIKKLSEFVPNAHFEAKGEVRSNEIILAVSLTGKGQLAATTVYASSDFDPKASAPTVQEILSACVDALATAFGSLLADDNPEFISQMGEKPLSAITNAPFDWTLVETNQRKIYIKLDKANLELDSITDDWLRKHDPSYIENEAEQESEMEKLFITGPRGPNTKGPNGDSSGSTH